MEHIKLFAPNDRPIVGVLAKDNSTRTFTYSYNRATQVRLYVLDDGTPLPDGPATLVDADGKQWNSTDVEWYTLFKRKA
jgi:hypothetical protein